MSKIHVSLSILKKFPVPASALQQLLVSAQKTGRKIGLLSVANTQSTQSKKIWNPENLYLLGSNQQGRDIWLQWAWIPVKIK